MRRIWEKHERIRPENANEIKEECTKIEFAFGNIFASNVEAFLEMLLDDTGGEESFFLLNIDFILSYVNEEGKDRRIELFVENKTNVIIRKLVLFGEEEKRCIQMNG